MICAYGFMKWRGDGEMRDMHRLVHLALRKWLNHIQDGFMTKDEAVEHLYDIFPSDEWENSRQFLPHTNKKEGKESVKKRLLYK